MYGPGVLPCLGITKQKVKLDRILHQVMTSKTVRIFPRGNIYSFAELTLVPSPDWLDEGMVLLADESLVRQS
jgi:hypothetical protein